ncbi:tetratricopeptide repeat protein [Nonomuraea typhae]|uniref:Tetratricopeptide repeat protein n=1 Tax=Nonomuraea typhae TaxID=2603600 RepID=A0ABW7Z2S2_9ACTN
MKCSLLMNVSTTIVVLLRDSRRILFTLGDLVRDTPEEFHRLNWPLLLDRGGVPVEMAETANADDLRAHLTDELNLRLVVFERLARACRENQGTAFVNAHWREFTSAAMTAAEVALTEDAPGLLMETTGLAMFAEQDADVLTSLVFLQLAVLAELCDEWTLRIRERSAEHSFEEDLRTFADGGTTVRTHPDVLHPLLDVGEGAGAEPYVMHALYASLCRDHDQANPEALRWAQLFFGQELLAKARPAVIRESTLISARRAQETIGYQEAWAAAAGWLAEYLNEGPLNWPSDASAELLEAFTSVAGKLGHPELISAVMQESYKVTSMPVGEMVAYVESARLTDEQGTLDILTKQADHLVAAERVDDLFLVAEAVRKRLGDGHAETWLCHALNTMGRPGSVLARIGETARPWEYELSVDLMVSLWQERASALSAAGRTAEALDLQQRIVVLLGSDSPRLPWAQTNLGLALMDSHRPDLALPIFEEAILSIGADRQLLTYKARALRALGETTPAEHAEREASALAAERNEHESAIEPARRHAQAG